MDRVKDNINIINAICNIFSIAWCTHITKLIGLKDINNYWIRIAIIFLVPIVFTSVPKLLKCKLSKDSNNKTGSKMGIIFDLFSILAICSNVYMIAYYISLTFYPSIVDLISITIMLFLVIYCLHITIKKLAKITYSKSIIVASIIILLGWFNSQELSLIAILSIVLNTILSIDDRKNLISFFEKKKIGNEIIWKQNIQGDLSDDELKGKFIAQKITIYIIIAMLYIVIKFTENTYFTLYLPAILNNIDLSSYPPIIQYLYKGMDRIIISLLIFIFLYSQEKIRHVFKKIFQPQNPNI
ncbi:hypothetical protein ACQQ97_07735 [Anaerovoracaceae bacterium SGI.195]